MREVRGALRVERPAKKGHWRLNTASAAGLRPRGHPDVRPVVRKDGVSSTGGCNSVLEFSGWGHEAEGLTGAGVQFQGDAVQVLLAVR